MPARDRRGAQLAVQIPPELLSRLKTYAAAQQRPMAELLRRWIEAGLAGALEAPAVVGTPSDLERRLQALEAAMRGLQKGAEKSITPPTKPVLSPEKPKPSVEVLALPLSGDATAKRLTTAELAELTGTNRSAWNNWARGKEIGTVRPMPTNQGQWKLAGKQAIEGGGPPRWLWERAEG